MSVDASFVASYRSALAAHASGSGETGLSQAYEIGRRALRAGLGVLDMVAIHHEAARSVPHESADSLHTFLVECLSPFEIVHRGVEETNQALRRMNDVLESEVRRIAHALHDEAGQMLVTVYIGLENLARRLPNESRPQISEVRARVDQVEERLRHLSHELRPTILDHLGLLPALRFLAEGVSSRSGLDVHVEGQLPQRLPADVELLLYRVVQEALADVVRSGKARVATVSVAHREDRVLCTVENDGAGFDGSTESEKRAPSLLIIHERVRALGGAVRVEPAKYKGTALTVSVPLKEAHP